MTSSYEKTQFKNNKIVFRFKMKKAYIKVKGRKKKKEKKFFLYAWARKINFAQ